MKKYLAGKLSRNTLVVVLCILGVIASAVWTASVGHMSNSSVTLRPQTAAGAYHTLQPAAAASNTGNLQSAGNAQGGSGTATQAVPAEPDPLYPIDPTPYCKTYINGGKIYCTYCDNSGSTNDFMPCGGCYGGGGMHPEIMCPNPL